MFTVSNNGNSKWSFSHAGLSFVCYDQPGCAGRLLNTSTTEEHCCNQNGISILNDGNCTQLQCLGIQILICLRDVYLVEELCIFKI